MERLSKRLLLLAFAVFWVATGTVSYAPPAEAQFGWFFGQPKKKVKPRSTRRARPPGDDLPPIKQRESLAPPPPVASSATSSCER